MTATFPLGEFTMDLSHVHDKMEIANSPYPQMDDIDLDFDNVRQQSIDRSMADDAELMQADLADVYNDDDMLDDEALQPSQSNQNDLEDLNMEAFDQDDQILDDDEVEEAASVDMAEQHDFAFAETLVSQIEDDEHSSRTIEELEQGAYAEHSDEGTNTVEIDQKNIQDQNIIVDAEEHLPDEEVEQDPADPTDVIDFAEEEHDEPRHEQLTKVQLPSTEDEQLPGEGLQDIHHNSIVAESQQSRPLESSNIPANEITTHENATADAAHPSISAEQDRALMQATESLHPITIVYLGQEMSLFPPMVDDSSATFFVSDTSLANEPVEILLAACREILGQSLEHDDELVLDIPTLGLHICEDSDFAAQLTLSQVVEVYLALCRNESAGNIDPLYCSLSSRVSLASQFAYLERSATDGKTFSEIAAEHADSPEQEVDSFEEHFQENHVDEAEHPFPPANQKVEVKDHSGLPDKGLMPRTVEDIQTIDNTDVDAQDPYEGTLEAHEDAVKQPDAEPKTSNEGLLQEVTVEANEDTAWQPLVSDAERGNEIEEHDEDEPDHQGQDAESGDNDTQHVENNSSTSSHTIEGENAMSSPGQEFNLEHVNTVDNGFEHNVNEDQDKFENLETAEDLFNEDVENNASTDHQDDENAQTEPEKDVTSNPLKPAEAYSSNGTTDYDQPKLDELSAEETFVFDEDGDTEEFDFLGVDDTTTSVPPVTPSKLHGGKRKALEEEEELDFNEISTPEPKRTRAS